MFPKPANFGPASASKRSRTGLLASVAALAVLLGVAALVLSIIAVTRGPEPQPPKETPQAQPEELFVEDADKALCEVIGPLMREETDRANAFLSTGNPDSPERKAAITKFKADTLGWANRTQSALNQHANPPRYLRALSSNTLTARCCTAKTCIRTRSQTLTTTLRTILRLSHTEDPLAPATK